MPKVANSKDLSGSKEEQKDAQMYQLRTCEYGAGLGFSAGLITIKNLTTMNIHELIHAWERNALPEDSQGLQDAVKTVEEHEAEVSKWEKEAISMPVKSLYNFPLGICAHLKNDLKMLSAAVASEKEGGMADES